MRKLTVEFEPNEMAKKEQESLFEELSYFEIIETLKVDHEEGLCVDLIECQLKGSKSIHDLKYIGNNEILSVLKSVGDTHTCLVKYREQEDSKEMFKEFDLDLIFTPPMRMEEDRFTCSCIGENENLIKLIELIRTFGEIEKMTFKKAAYQNQDILSVLTEKQKEVMITAHRSGYYDYPKKISSELLSEKVNIKRTTLLEHLRKAEGRILTEILAGY